MPIQARRLVGRWGGSGINKGGTKIILLTETYDYDREIVHGHSACEQIDYTESIALLDIPVPFSLDAFVRTVYVNDFIEVNITIIVDMHKCQSCHSFLAHRCTHVVMKAS